MPNMTAPASSSLASIAPLHRFGSVCSALTMVICSRLLTVLTVAVVAKGFSISTPSAAANVGQKEAEKVARDNHNNEVWNALFVPVMEQTVPVPCTSTTGNLPSDFPCGSLLRIGPNGAGENEAMLDGDGMVHCITFPPNGQPNLASATYVDTKGRQMEKMVLKKYKGTLSSAPKGWPLLGSVIENAVNFWGAGGPAQKDTCNTALAHHGDRVLALMEQCPPSEIQINRDGTVKTIEASTLLNGGIPTALLTGGALSAHGRTCPESGDRVHVSYSSVSQPFCRVDVFDSDSFNLQRSIPVDLPAPIMIHDCAITENYALIVDFPLTLRTRRLLIDEFPVEYEPDSGARFGLVSRRNGNNNDNGIRWFDSPTPSVILHVANAYETADKKKVVIHALRSEPSLETSYITEYATTFLHEWILDLETGTCTETGLNDNELVDFPVIDERFNGKQVNSVYCSIVSGIGGPLKVHTLPAVGITIGGVVEMSLKSDTKGQVVGRYTLPTGWYAVSEPTVVPKVGKSDDTYVMLIATQVPDDPTPTCAEIGSTTDALQSKVFVLDGQSLDDGPVWETTLPYRVNYGLHSMFLDWEKMK